MDLSPCRTPGRTKSADYPIEFVRRKSSRKIYIYRLPNDKTKCFRFSLWTRSKRGMRCRGCLHTHNRQLRNWNKKNRESKCPKTRKVQVRGDFSVIEDPTLDHLPGCRAESYSTVTKGLKHVTNAQQANKKYILEVWSTEFRVCALYRLPQVDGEDATCLRFYTGYRPQLRKTVLQCTMCSTLVRQQETPSNDGHLARIWRTGCLEDGFAENPTLGHVAGCKPQLYTEVLKQFDSVRKDEARRKIVTYTSRNPIPSDSALDCSQEMVDCEDADDSNEDCAHDSSEHESSDSDHNDADYWPTANTTAMRPSSPRPLSARISGNSNLRFQSVEDNSQKDADSAVQLGARPSDSFISQPTVHETEYHPEANVQEEAMVTDIKSGPVTILSQHSIKEMFASSMETPLLETVFETCALPDDGQKKSLFIQSVAAIVNKPNTEDTKPTDMMPASKQIDQPRDDVSDDDIEIVEHKRPESSKNSNRSARGAQIKIESTPAPENIAVVIDTFEHVSGEQEPSDNVSVVDTDQNAGDTKPTDMVPASKQIDQPRDDGSDDDIEILGHSNKKARGERTQIKAESTPAAEPVAIVICPVENGMVKQERGCVNNAIPRQQLAIQGSKVFTKSFNVMAFNEEEVQAAMNGRTVEIVCIKQVKYSSVESSEHRLSYRYELPGSVDVTTVRLAWDDNQLTLTANPNT